MPRAAMTQTRNVYGPMPESIDDLASLAERLESLRIANVEHHLALIAEARLVDVEVIGLGELCTAPYFALGEHAFWRDLAEDAETGPTVTAMRLVAAQHRMVIVVPIYERDGEACFNTAVVIDADGRIAGTYRKLHIPCGRNELGAFSETFYYGPGNGAQNEGRAGVLGDDPLLPVFETAVGRVGVAICYDRHFEGVMSGLAAAGAQLVFSPAVTFGATSQRMWGLEFLVDAARHRLFIGGSNRCGAERPWNQDYFGDSYFAGPSGRVDTIDHHANLVIADLDFTTLADADSGWDLQRDRRDDLIR